MTKEVTVLNKIPENITLQAQDLVIIDDKSLTQGVKMLSQLNKWNDQVMEEKEKLTKPLNATLKEIRGRYKPIEELLETAINSIRGKMITFQTERTNKQKEEEAKITDRIGEGKGKLKIETATKKLEDLGEVDTKFEGDNGSVKFKVDRKFEVVDLSKLPVEYHLADEVKIRKVMKAGIELEGVKYWDEQIPYNSR